MAPKGYTTLAQIERLLDSNDLTVRDIGKIRKDLWGLLEDLRSAKITTWDGLTSRLGAITSRQHTSY